MIDSVISATACGIVFITAMLVIACMEKDFGYQAILGRGVLACGLLLLGSRYAYLIYEGDIGRLSFYGTASISLICLGKIILCVGILRRKREGG